MADQNDADPEGTGSAALTPENIKQQLQKRFLTPSNKLPKHWLKDWQLFVVIMIREIVEYAETRSQILALRARLGQLVLC
jgi:hypothetical protein